MGIDACRPDPPRERRPQLLTGRRLDQQPIGLPVREDDRPPWWGHGGAAYGEPAPIRFKPSRTAEPRPQPQGTWQSTPHGRAVNAKFVATDIATSRDLSTLPTSTTRRKGRSMTVRRVATGHSPDGEAIFVSDTEVPPMPIGDRGSATTTL